MTEGKPTFRCIYCGHTKSAAERSLEHIWPQSQGGHHAPDFFKTNDVCTRCNNNVGLFVDAEYLRSFFIGAESISAALRFLDDTRLVALPLVYMGINPKPPNQGELCEHWLGPRGEKIFYLHCHDREDYAMHRFGSRPLPELAQLDALHINMEDLDQRLRRFEIVQTPLLE